MYIINIEKKISNKNGGNMGYKELLEELDNIDINMLNNLNDNNVFINNNDIQVRMRTFKIRSI